MLGLQISFNKTSIEKNRFNSPKNNDIKPSGGLWSSTLTLNQEFLSEWHEFGTNVWGKNYFQDAVIFRFKPTARIYTIDGQSDLKRLE